MSKHTKIITNGQRSKLLMSKHVKIIAMFSAMAAIGGGSAAYAAIAPDDNQPLSPREAAAIKTVAVPVVQDQITNNFPLFRNQPATPMPRDIAEQVASPETHGRNATLARSFQTPYGTGWVIPGDGYLCIAVPTTTNGSGTSCVPTELAIERGLWLRIGGSRADGKVLETVVAPDGANVVSGTKTLPTSADGVVSEFINTDESSGPKLVPAG